MLRGYAVEKCKMLMENVNLFGCIIYVENVNLIVDKICMGNIKVYCIQFKNMFTSD